MGGKSSAWHDVEGDEATLDKRDVSTDEGWQGQVQDKKCILWEQWSGLVQGGKPRTLILSQLKPSLTTPRLILLGLTSSSCQEFCVTPSSTRKNVSKSMANGQPNFVKVVKRKLPTGKSIKVKAGVQHIDRAWKFIKDRLTKGPNSRA